MNAFAYLLARWPLYFLFISDLDSAAGFWFEFGFGFGFGFVFSFRLSFCFYICFCFCFYFGFRISLPCQTVCCPTETETERDTETKYGCQCVSLFKSDMSTLWLRLCFWVYFGVNANSSHKFTPFPYPYVFDIFQLDSILTNIMPNFLWFMAYNCQCLVGLSICVFMCFCEGPYQPFWSLRG